jgi:penicillin-binding protein A
MKILSRRTVIVMIFIIAFLLGIFILVGTYLKSASKWVQYPTNQHLFTNGQLKTGTIYDRNGAILSQTVKGVRKYNSDKTVRTAVMQDIGDSNGDVSTGVQVACGKQIGGWNLLNGVYRFGTAEKNIHLTLNSSLCAAAYNALNGRRGTVGVYNYKTGEILCDVSFPSFDPENPPDIKTNAEAYNGVYLNRLFSSTYTPGSVFKLVTAAAAIDNISNVTNRTFHCNGTLNIDGGKVTCPEPHGYVSFKQALSDSCNVTFATLAHELGGKVLQSYAEKAGCNSSLTVDGIKTATGKVTTANVTGANLGWAGVGQYTDTVNPLNFLAYVGAIANDGVRISPRLFENSSSQGTRILSANTAKIIKNMMRYDVLNNYGDANYPGLVLCAKSGTAQLSEGEQPNAWFVGFMDRTDCPLAFVVVIENGGAGSTVAGPVAGNVLQAALSSMAAK